MRQFKIDENRKTFRSDSFGRYAVDVNRYPILTPDKEFEVACQARAGDPKAIDTLVNANLRFVISVAKAYAGGSGDKLNDLINEGNLGLVEAAQDFDPSTGFKFISYAVWHVRKNMLKYLTDNSRTMRLPQNRVQALQKMKGIEDKLAFELGRDPQDWEIFARYEEIEIREGRINGPLKPEQIESLKAASRAGIRASSLDGPSTDDPSDQFGPINVINGDPLGADWDVTHDSATQFLARQISRLSIIEKEIVTSYHGIGRTAETFSSLAERWGYSTENIRQKYKKAMRKMQVNVRRSGVKIDEVI